MPTRITTKSATLIDHMFFYEGANQNDISTVKSGNIFSNFSDHLSNFTLLTRSLVKKDFSNRPKIRLFTEKNKAKFESELLKVDWNNLVYTKLDVDDAYNSFDSAITKCFNKCFLLTRLLYQSVHARIKVG